MDLTRNTVTSTRPPAHPPHPQAFIGSVIISTLPGLRLYYFGQFKGYKNKLDVHLRRALPEATNTTVEGLYHQLLDIVSDDIFHTGTW